MQKTASDYRKNGRGERASNWTAVLVTILVLTFGLLVWPGMWEYANESSSFHGGGAGSSSSYPLRINRVTGEVQEWDGNLGRWQRLGTK